MLLGNNLQRERTKRRTKGTKGNKGTEQRGHSTLVSSYPRVKSSCEGVGAKSEVGLTSIPCVARTRLPIVSVIGHLSAQLQTVGNEIGSENFSQNAMSSRLVPA